MRLRYRRKVCLVLALTLLACALLYTGAVCADESDTRSIQVFIDGSQLTFAAGQEPMLMNDRTMVPLRAVSEALDATVYWFQDDQRIQIVKYDTTLSMQLNVSTLEVYDIVDGAAQLYKTVVLDSPPVQADESHGYRTYVPLRVIAESFGADVSWDFDADNNMVVNIVSHNDKTQVNTVQVSGISSQPENTLFSVSGRIVVIGGQYFLQDLFDPICFVELTEVPQEADYWTQQLGVANNNPHGCYVTITGIMERNEAGYPTIPLKRSITGIRTLTDEARMNILAPDAAAAAQG